MKTMMKPLGFLFALTLLLAGCGGSGSSGSATPQPRGALDVGGTGVTLEETVDVSNPETNLEVDFSAALAINDANEVIGYVELAPEAPFEAALWAVDVTGDTPTVTPRQLASIDPAGFSAAFALDELGNAVGQSAAGAQLVAVVWENGSSTPTALPALAPGNSKALAISADGSLIAGSAINDLGVTRAVVWAADGAGGFSAPTALLVPGFANGSIFGSANSVVRVATNEILVVGEAEAGDGTIHAILWRSLDNGVSFTAIDLGPGHIAYGVNEARRIVGENDDDLSPVSWQVNELGVAGIAVSLADVGSAVAINNNDRIAGWINDPARATVWNGTIAAPPLFNTDSRAYGLNNNPDPLVVGQNGTKGFIKRVN